MQPEGGPAVTLQQTSSQKDTDAGEPPRSGLALLFPGQGSQHEGMGKRIAQLSKAARQIFSDADDVLDTDVSRLCFEGSEEELEDTVNTQPAMLTTSIAHLAYLRERLEELGRRLWPSLIAGHSLGQYSAAVAADALDFSDGLRLVQKRGRIMADWAKDRPGGLAAVLGLQDDDVDQICREASSEGTVAIAVHNCPGQVVISGDTASLENAMSAAKERGGRVRRLPISVPSHTPLMRDAARELARFSERLSFRNPSPPLVSNISAKLLTTAEEVREELSNQICAAVQWARCVIAMANEGAGPFVEVGPGQALTNLLRRIKGDTEGLATENASDASLRSLAETLPHAVPVEAAPRRQNGT
ncbi:MAG: ACP S-malonyltransferase [Chloroflexi bacterium]|nr:ACP S-malonyltransferase [Chloroflexota bacterium]